MKSLLKAVLLLSMTFSSFADGIIADLQYECERVNKNANKDVQTIRIFNASTYFNKKKAIIEEFGSLYEVKYKKVNGGITISYDGGYEDDNLLTVSFSNKLESSLKVGSRTVALECVGK